MSDPDRLSGIRAKIERAKYHVDDLEGRIRAFREANPNLLICNQNPQTSERVFRLTRQLPTEFSLVVGDAVHNLRSALDHLACQLVTTAGHTPNRNTSFPIMDGPPRDRTAFNRKVQGVSPDAIRLINAVQPYQSEYELTSCSDN